MQRKNFFWFDTPKLGRVRKVCLRMAVVAAAVLLTLEPVNCFQLIVGDQTDGCQTLVSVMDFEKEYAAANRVAIGGVTYSPTFITGTTIAACTPRPVPFVQWF